MSEAGPAVVQVGTANDDLEHLRLLSIFHYVVAGLMALVALIPVFHLVMGFLLATGALEDSDDPAARVVGWVFVGFALLFIVLGMAMAAAVGLAGRYLSARRHFTYCLVVAAVECMFMPFGTVLGVFTLIVLLRPSVKALFESTTHTVEA